jgi:hypothetical protein
MDAHQGIEKEEGSKPNLSKNYASISSKNWVKHL